MATVYLYANSDTGDDVNDGLTVTTAKKTLSEALDIAVTSTNLNILRITGVFNEGWAASKGTYIHIKGYKGAVLSGKGLVEGIWHKNYSIHHAIGIEDVDFVDWTATAYKAATYTQGGYITNCNFLNCAVGVELTYITANSHTYVRSSTFVNCGVGVRGHVTNTNYMHFDYCTFAGNDVDINHPKNISYIVVNHCVLSGVIMYDMPAMASVSYPVCDYNVYDFTNGKIVGGGTDYLSLASWTAATGEDKSSYDEVLTFEDLDAGLCKPAPASDLLTKINGFPVGYQYPAVSISNGINAAVWTNGVFVNTEIDGSGDVILSAGQILGTFATDTLDFGAAIPLRHIRPVVQNESVTEKVDTDTGANPDYLVMEVRGADISFLKTDEVLAWVSVPRNGELADYLPQSSYRYLQIRLTLRAP